MLPNTGSGGPGTDLEPAGQDAAKLLMTRWFGVALLAGAPVLGYFTIWKPAMELQHTGQTTYYIKGILLPPLLVYMGVALLLGDFRDGQIKYTDANGKVRFTRKGKWFAAGVIVLACLTMFCWHLYLRQFGASVFD